jgi:rubrerythrin
MMAEDTDRSLQMLATALEKEEKGRDFYEKAASTCANELGKEIFGVLTVEEGIHIQRVKEIYDSLKGAKSWTGDWKKYTLPNENLQELFRERMIKLGPKVNAETGDLEAVDIGMGFEQGAIEFYEEELTKAEDPLEREFIERMIQEERSHFASLSDMKLYLTNPQSWLAEVERHGLDGA